MNNFVMANGCFDVLHAGHCKFIHYCVEMKKYYNAHLIFAIDSDEKIKKDKGENRPIFSEQERKKHLKQYCPHIDTVIVFNSNEDLCEIIKSYNPILIKGYRWHGNVVGGEHAKNIHYCPDFPNLPSTTEIENKIKNSIYLSSIMKTENLGLRQVCTCSLNGSEENNFHTDDCYGNNHMKSLYGMK